MSKIHLEELEPRFLLTSSSLASFFSLPQPSAMSAGYSSVGGYADGHANPVRPGEGGGEMGQAPSPVQKPPLAESRDIGNPGGWWNVAGPPRIVIVEVTLTPIAAPTNVGAERLASPGPENGGDALPVERAPATGFSVGTNPPLASGTAITTAVFNVPVPATGASPVPSPVVAAGPSPTVAAGINAGIQYNTNSFALHNVHNVTALLGYTASFEPTGPNGTQGQGWLFPPPPASGTAVPPSLSEMRSLGQQAIPSLLLPPLELGPQDQHDELLPHPYLSSLGAGLRRFLAVLGPLGQQAVPLSPPDLSDLEAGLFQFLAELGDASAHLAVGQDGAATRIWIVAAAAAGAACAIAYRQQRRSAAESATDVLLLPGCSLDDA